MNATVLSCFSGLGGLDLGLEAAGFETVGCLEIDAAARVAMALNRPSWQLLEPSNVVAAGKILRPSDLGLEKGDLTLLAGGPPCQPFSKAAQWAAPKQGVRDERGQTTAGMLDLIEHFLPRAVLIENVSGYLSGRNNAAPLIEQRFKEINATHGTAYNLSSWVVNAADYGVPQYRRRAVVIAFRDGSELPGTLPTTHADKHATAWDAIGGVMPSNPPKATGKYSDLLPSIPEGGNYQYLTARGAGSEHEVFGYRTRFWSFLLKLSKSQPAWTLPASPGPSTGPFHWENRPLTGTERLLLQGFPAEWKLTGNERVDARLAGNATPPPLAESMGRLILAMLEDPSRVPHADTIRPVLAVQQRDAAPPPPHPAAPLPLRWRAVVGSKEPHPGPGQGPGGHAPTDFEPTDSEVQVEAT
ncbi:DNA cytosine methyltransferase [Agromyces sp. LHK192]|uniref:DNA cytosine methyltransferase n=1 Tax=Agromyces sp. LHK192 TaxID=2498704 RepID=UPI000FD7F8E0|nr:DNA cytosine methyltransferase [Agromyces sp. LHK192]